MTQHDSDIHEVDGYTCFLSSSTFCLVSFLSVSDSLRAATIEREGMVKDSGGRRHGMVLWCGVWCEVALTHKGHSSCACAAHRLVS